MVMRVLAVSVSREGRRSLRAYILPIKEVLDGMWRCDTRGPLGRYLYADGFGMDTTRYGPQKGRASLNAYATGVARDGRFMATTWYIVLNLHERPDEDPGLASSE